MLFSVTGIDDQGHRLQGKKSKKRYLLLAFPTISGTTFSTFTFLPHFWALWLKRAEGGVEVCRCVNLWHSSFSKRQAFVLPKFALLEIILGAAAGESANKICLTSYIYKQWIVCTNLFIVPMGGQKVRTESFYSDKYDLPICTYRFWLKKNNR